MCVSSWSYPERAVGHINLSPSDDDGVFDGLDWSVHTQICAISFVGDFNVDSAAFSILSEHNSLSAQVYKAICKNIECVFELLQKNW